MRPIVKGRHEAAAASEAADGERVDARLSPAGEHDVCFAGLYKTRSVAQRVSACRAGCRDGVVGTLGCSGLGATGWKRRKSAHFQSIPHRDVAGSQVYEETGDEEWMDFVVVLLVCLSALVNELKLFKVAYRLMICNRGVIEFLEIPDA